MRRKSMKVSSSPSSGVVRMMTRSMRKTMNESSSSGVVRMMTRSMRKTMNESSSSSEVVGVIHIPKDVMIHILSMSSARNLLHLRWACKYLFNLITLDPSFINMHLHHYNHHQSINHYPRVLIHIPKQPKSYRKGFVEYNFNEDEDDASAAVVRSPSFLKIKLYDWPDERRHGYKFLGSCNGLILISRFYMTSEWRGVEWIIIWNPCTKRVIWLPDIPTVDGENMTDKIYGFGYDHVIHDYKVIIVSSESRVETVVYIYTLGTNSWRRVGGFPPYAFHGSISKIVYNEVLYSFVRKNKIPNKKEDVLLCFDIVKEECKEISIMSTQLPIPTGILSMTSREHIFGEFKGCLCLFITFQDSWELTNHELWVLDEHNNSSGCPRESWTKLRRITKTDFIPDRDITHCLRPLRICNNGEILVIVNDQHVVWYNPEDEKTRFVATISPTSSTVPIGIYIESLVCLNTRNYMGQEELRKRRRINTKGNKQNGNKKRKSS